MNGYIDLGTYLFNIFDKTESIFNKILNEVLTANW